MRTIEAQQVSLADQERMERERTRGAYLRSPAGADLEMRLAGIARAYCVALSYEQHPGYYHDAEERRARPRFTGQPCEHGDHCGGISFGWCACGMTADEIGDNFMAAVEEAQRQADEWEANGAPGAPFWYR